MIDPGRLVVPPPSGIQSSRQRVENLTAPADCRGCHAQINSHAFALWNIDTLGVPRNEERIYRAEDGAYLGTLPIDSAISVQFGSQTLRATGPVEYAQMLLQTRIPQSCFVRQFFVHAFGREANRDGEEACMLASAHQKINDPSTSVRDALQEMARSTFFMSRFAGAP